MAVTLFKSTDSGAPTLSGTAGDLVTLLDQVMILGRGFSFNGNTLGFTDNSAALRQRGVGVALFPQPAGGDILYLGGAAKFGKAIFNLTTLGVGGAYTVEFWNGGAWTPIVGLTDGTAGLTVSGTMQWAIGGQNGWVPVAVNAVTLYWIRIVCSSTPSVGPEANLASIYGWGSPFQGTNGRTYRSELTNGVQHYFNVDDNAPGAGTGKEARIYGAEVMSAYDTVSSGRFPTAAQFANGMFIRKSNTADATLRAWVALLDEKTVYLFVLSGDSANNYVNVGFGEFYSLLPGDLYRSFVSGRQTENSAVLVSVESLTTRITATNSGSTGAQGTYVARGYLGTGAALLVALTAGYPGAWIGPQPGVGNVPTFNGPDGGIVLGPAFLYETGNQMRGRLRGIYDSAHAAAAFADRDTFQGAGLISSKAFLVIKGNGYTDQNGNSGLGNPMVTETSDTWETV